MRDLDAQLNAKEADLATALSENRNLENDLRELKDQVATVRLVPGTATLLSFLKLLLVFSQLVRFKSRAGLLPMAMTGRQKDFCSLAESKCYWWLSLLKLPPVVGTFNSTV